MIYIGPEDRATLDLQLEAETVALLRYEGSMFAAWTLRGLSQQY